jgi:hypothetical protein
MPSIGSRVTSRSNSFGFRPKSGIHTPEARSPSGHYDTQSREDFPDMRPSPTSSGLDMPPRSSSTRVGISEIKRPSIIGKSSTRRTLVFDSTGALVAPDPKALFGLP